MTESKPLPAKLSRRQAVAAGAVGAVAAAAVSVPLLRREAAVPATPAAAAADAKTPGYQVTQHVLRYYETTRI